MDDLNPAGVAFVILFAWILPVVLVFGFVYLVAKGAHKFTHNKLFWSKHKHIEVIIAAVITFLFFAAVTIQSYLVT